ncbi:MAG: LON peptidase substrate-binding domain-containing protein [Candidatus Binatus sp.]
MSTPQGPRKRLPENPSEENLRKQAKRLAKQEGLQLALAQRRLAIEYGYANWAELIRAIATPFVPMLPLRELVAFPLEVYPIYVGRPKSISAIDAVTAGAPILLIAQRDATVGEPSVRDMYQVGTLGVIVERQNLPNGTAKIMVEGRKRARVKRFVFEEEFYKAEVEEVADTERLNFIISAPGAIQPASARREHAGALIRLVLSALDAYVVRKRKTVAWRELEDPGVLPYVIAHHLKIDLAEQQALLECVSQVERLEKILRCLEAAK